MYNTLIIQIVIEIYVNYIVITNEYYIDIISRIISYICVDVVMMLKKNNFYEFKNIPYQKKYIYKNIIEKIL